MRLVCWTTTIPWTRNQFALLYFIALRENKTKPLLLSGVLRVGFLQEEGDPAERRHGAQPTGDAD